MKLRRAIRKREAGSPVSAECLARSDPREADFGPIPLLEGLGSLPFAPSGIRRISVSLAGIAGTEGEVW